MARRQSVPPPHSVWLHASRRRLRQWKVPQSNCRRLQGFRATSSCHSFTGSDSLQVGCDTSLNQGRSQDLVSGGASPISGGPDPLFFASDPKSQGSPLMYFWLPPDFGGGGRAPPAPPPGYALGLNLCQIAHKRGSDALAASCLQLPFLDSSFDFAISIAVIHHLATEVRLCVQSKQW